MKIAVLSDTRLPTNINYPGHGLGRQISRLAVGLSARGHDVTVYGGFGSVVDGCTVVESAHEDQRAHWLADQPLAYDALIDGSHHFGLATLREDWPIVCKVADLEGNAPRNRVYGFPGLAVNIKDPDGLVIHEGIDVDNIPFNPGPRDSHLVFAAHWGAAFWKKPELAVEVAHKAGREIWVVGDGTPAADTKADKVMPAIAPPEFYQVLGKCAAAVSHRGATYFFEAAACGTPFLTQTTETEFPDGVVGFYRESVDDLAACVDRLGEIDPARCREWVAETHGIGAVAAKYEKLLERAANGERW